MHISNVKIIKKKDEEFQKKIKEKKHLQELIFFLFLCTPQPSWLGMDSKGIDPSTMKRKRENIMAAFVAAVKRLSSQHFSMIYLSI